MCEKGHFFQKPNLAEGESIEELDGGFFVLQKRGLYRFTSDAIALSRFASAKKGEVIADLCSGSGVVSLNFCALHGGVVKRADLYEIQPELAALSERSVALSGLGGRFFVHNVSIADIGDAERGKFSLVLCNPPYEKAGSGEKSGLPSDEIARHETAVTLETVVGVSAKILKFGGRLAVCHRASRLAELFYLMRAACLEPKRLAYSQSGRVVFVEAVKGGSVGLTTEFPNPDA